MPKKLRKWTLKEQGLIKEVKCHPILYTTDPLLNARKGEYRMKTRHIWDDIAIKIKSPVSQCKRKWYDMKYKYAKLKEMILKGIVPQKSVRKHRKTSKYMDGSLDFLDPYISELPDYKLTPSIRAFLHSVFPLNSGISLGIHAEGENNSIQNLALLQEEDTESAEMEPTSILPTFEDDEIEEDNNRETFLLGHPFAENPVINQSFKVEIVGDENIFTVLETEEHILPNIIHEIQDETMDTTGHDNHNIDDIYDPAEVTLINRKNTEDIINNTTDDNVDDATIDTLEAFLIKHDTDNDTGTTINEYLKDLADVLCVRLTVGKRKHFLSQIDLLVSEILESKNINSNS